MDLPGFKPLLKALPTALPPRPAWISAGLRWAATVSTSTLWNNYALQGGGIWNDGTAVVVACQVFANSAATNGGGFWTGWGGTLTVKISVFAGNTPDAIQGPWTGSGNIFL